MRKPCRLVQLAIVLCAALAIGPSVPAHSSGVNITTVPSAGGLPSNPLKNRCRLASDTGKLYCGNGVSWVLQGVSPNSSPTVSGLTFEGPTEDANEGLLTAADPTADRTWTLPDKSGTVAMTSDIVGDVVSAGKSSGQTVYGGTVNTSGFSLYTHTQANSGYFKLFPTSGVANQSDPFCFFCNGMAIMRAGAGGDGIALLGSFNGQGYVEATDTVGVNMTYRDVGGLIVSSMKVSLDKSAQILWAKDTAGASYFTYHQLKFNADGTLLIDSPIVIPSGNPLDLTAAKPRVPNGNTAGKPATCSVGEVYGDTQAPAICLCTATNTWKCSALL